MRRPTARLALAGLILGYVGLALTVIGTILFVAFVVWAAHQGSNFAPPPNGS